MAKEDSVNWSDLKKIFQDADKNELIDLVRDLYKRSADDRRFITARYMGMMSGDQKGQMLEKYRKLIVNEFFPERGEEKLRYSVAKKAISDYSKASGDPKGTLDLMFTYVENGVEYTNTYGDIDRQFISTFMECCQRSVTSFGKKKNCIRCSGKGCSRSARIRAI